MEEENRYFIFDSENGELVRGLGNNLDGILNTSGNLIGTRIEGIREFKKTNYKYVKVNLNALSDLCDISPLAVKILKYVSYKENSLMFSNGTYINQTNLAKALGVSREHICNTFKKLKENEVISTIKKGRKTIYILNPYIATRGNETYIEVMNKFIKTKWEGLAEERGKRNEL